MKNNIIFLGCTDNFDRRFSACNTKIGFLAKGLNIEKDSCSIVESIVGSNLISEREEKLIEGIGKVITYPKKYNQLISWLYNIVPLFRDLKKLRNEDCNNCIVLEAPDYHIYIIYVIISRLLKYKIITIAHEWGPTVTSVHWIRKPSVWLYTKTFGYLSDAILPISEYIKNKIIHFNKPYLKIPIIADFDNCFNKRSQESSFFLYCVGASYFRVIKTIIESYRMYKNGGGRNCLFLVLSGTENNILLVKKYIQDKGLIQNIKVFTQLPYSELLNLYSEANALIIPLDPTSEQDQARFSQKISEYLSTGTPIISNNVGEIKFYFKDRYNILLCEYSIDGFKNIFTWIDTHTQEAILIGQRGYELGKKEFNYRKYGKLLHVFLNE